MKSALLVIGGSFAGSQGLAKLPRGVETGRPRSPDTLRRVRVLVVTNFVPDDDGAAARALGPRPGRRGAQARDRGRRLQLPPGRNEYIPATRRLRGLLRRERFDLVHAHYGLAGWCAQLAGARPLLVTFHGTDVRHGVVGPLSRRLAWRVDLVAGGLAGALRRRGRPPRPARRARAPRSSPAARTSSRFGPHPRGPRPARALGLDPDGRYLFFPANPARPEKRHDRAAELAAACGAELLTGGSIEPERMPTWINAANAVLVTSDYEGFGMAAVEALACDVPVLSTPVGDRALRPGRHRRLPLRALRRRRLGRRRPPPPRRRRPPRGRRRAGRDALRGARWRSA